MERVTVRREGRWGFGGFVHGGPGGRVERPVVAFCGLGPVDPTGRILRLYSTVGRASGVHENIGQPAAAPPG
jgi:hypothetical protein